MSKPKIVQKWDELPPVVWDGEESFSTRVLERKYERTRMIADKAVEAILNLPNGENILLMVTGMNQEELRMLLKDDRA